MNGRDEPSRMRAHLFWMPVFGDCAPDPTPMGICVAWGSDVPTICAHWSLLLAVCEFSKPRQRQVFD